MRKLESNTKEYLNHRGTKIRVFRVCCWAPFLIFPPSFPFRPCSLSHHFSLFTSPFNPPFLTPGKLRFRYPSDLGTLSGVGKRVVSKRVVLADVPPNENRNEGTFGCSPGTKTGTRVRSTKPPFYETTLLSLSDSLVSC